MLSRELINIADALEARRLTATGHGLWCLWPTVAFSVTEVHNLEVALRDLACRVAALEQLPVPETARRPDRPRLTLVWSNS